MRNILFVFLIFFSLGEIRFEASRRDYYSYHQSLLEEFLALVDVEKPSGARPKASLPTADDLDLNHLNALNDEEIERMPKIRDFSDEEAAREWLNWYYRIAKRYSQVRRKSA